MAIAPNALAGVGLANQIVWLITVFFMAVSVGSTALIARARGAGDGAAANQVLRQSLIVGLVMGALATVVGFALAEPAMLLLGAGADVLVLLGFGLGLTGIWVAMATDFIVQAALAFWQFQRGRWKTLRV